MTEITLHGYWRPLSLKKKYFVRWTQVQNLQYKFLFYMSYYHILSSYPKLFLLSCTFIFSVFGELCVLLVVRQSIFRTGGILFLQLSNNCQNYINIFVFASEKIGLRHFSNFIGDKKKIYRNLCSFYFWNIWAWILAILEKIIELIK